MADELGKWTAADIPDQTRARRGRHRRQQRPRAVTARELARAGASVVLACRNTDKGEEAAAARSACTYPAPTLSVEALDLADLASVRAFARARADGNARPADQQRRRDGAAAAADRGRLREPVRHQPPRPLRAHRAAARAAAGRAGAARGHASRAARTGSARSTSTTCRASAVQQLARLRPVEARQPDVLLRAPAARDRGGHRAEEPRRAPGLRRHQPPVRRARPTGTSGGIMAIGTSVIAQSADMGALPTLYAATVPDLPGGSFVGPDGLFEQRGHPHVVSAAGKAYDEEAWRRLWEVSEQLTGVHYEFGVRVTDLRADGRRGARVGGQLPRARVRELPVLAQVRPGEIRARLPATRARRARAVLRRPARPRRGAAAGRHALAAPALLRLLRHYRRRAGRSSPSCSRRRSTRSRSCGGPRRPRPSSRASCSTGPPSCSGCRSGWHGHIEDTASTSTLAALTARADGHRSRSGRVLRAGALVGRQGGPDARHAPAQGSRATTTSGCGPTRSATLSDAAAIVATVGTTASTAVDPVPAIADACERRGSMAACRRRLRGRGDGVPRVPVGVRGRRSRRLARGQRPQVDADADGLLAAVDPLGPRTFGARSASSPSTCGRPMPRMRSASASTARRSGGGSAR